MTFFFKQILAVVEFDHAANKIEQICTTLFHMSNMQRTNLSHLPELCLVILRRRCCIASTIVRDCFKKNNNKKQQKNHFRFGKKSHEMAHVQLHEEKKNG